jgi:hypothetical protein
MKRGKTYDWLPLWRDKWLLGSTRWELDPAERSVFIDFLCHASADDGWVRANPDTPYPLPWLAATLQVPVDVLTRTIDKCIEVGKLKRDERGCLFICSWQQYQLTPRYKKQLLAEKDTDTDTETERDTERGTQKCEHASQNCDLNHSTEGKPPTSTSVEQANEVESEGLLAIPKGLPFEEQDELVKRRAEIRRQTRLLERGVKQNGPNRLTAEGIEAQKQAFNDRVRDFS